MAIRYSSLSRAGLSTGTSSRPSGRPGQTDPCPPPCPACGGLECLCRPRFFAGQLLSEQDLNRLDAYIRGKNRLHNRSLHGWGVVCGLEVTCHDCENLVMVSPGHALSPCGDDIVLCQEDAVDVCGLIRACDPARKRPQCDPPRQADPGCKEGEETWVLAVCYAEHPSRGVTALRSTGCACGGGSGGSGGSGSGGCGCGGGGGVKAYSSGGGSGGKGGCGCGSNGSGKSQASSSSTATASGATTPSRLGTQCEPTVICESWDYRVWRAPAEIDDDGRGRFSGPLVDRMMCCAQPYLDWATAAGNALNAQSTPQQQNRVCCQAKERLRGILLERPVHDCTMLARLDAIACPPVNDPNFADRLSDALLEMVTLWFQALMSCVCSALLPPCPGAQDGNCVPLATVTVRRSQGGCRILRVCNWTVHRKFATTFPNLEYWSSVLPFVRYLREAMEELCCNLRVRFDRGDDDDDTPDNPTTTTVPGAKARAARSSTSAGSGAEDGFKVNDPFPFSSARSRETSTLLASVALGTATPLDPMSLFRGLAGSSKARVEDTKTGFVGGQPRMSTLERENLPQYLLASQLIPATLAGAAPHDPDSLVPGLLALASRLGIGGSSGGKTTARAQPADGDVEGLRAQLAELRTAMEAQQRTIDQLTERLDKQ
jgi:hypothetical protein